MDVNILLDEALRRELDVNLDTIQFDEEDLVLVIDGKEGSGKSKLARQIGHYCAERMKTPFSVDNIHFGLKEYIRSCQTLEKNPLPGAVNILDESRNVLSKRKGLSKELNGFTDYLSECRALQGIHILCVPASHDLDKNITMWRMKFLVHCIKQFVKDETRPSGYKLQRGDYCIFMTDDMADFYYNPQRFGYYKYPKRMMHDRKYYPDGRFSNKEVLENVAIYKKKKIDAMGDKYDWITEDQDSPKEIKSKDSIIIGKYFKKLEEDGFTRQEIATMNNVNGMHVTRRIRLIE